MDAKDVRIGNWVKTDTGREYKIDLSWFDCCRNSSEGRDIQLDTYPIPLTEEGMTKFGITSEFHTSLGNIYEVEWKGDGYNVYNMGVLIAFVKYVHTFQNLYYALTNEELIIK